MEETLKTNLKWRMNSLAWNILDAGLFFSRLLLNLVFILEDPMELPVQTPTLFL